MCDPERTVIALCDKRIEGLAKLIAGIVLLVGLGVANAEAQERATCEALISAADSAYVVGSFGESIQLIDDCLRLGTATEGEFVAAYRLLILSYVRMDQLSEARVNALQLLSEIPTYTPDPIFDPPAYVVLIEAVREQFRRHTAESIRPPSWFRANSRWLVGGGALIAGGLLAIMLADGSPTSGGSTELPLPPTLPP